MRVASRAFLLLPVLLASVACHDGAGEARASLLETDRAFAALSAEQGFDAAFRKYAADTVVLLPEQAGPIKGKGAVLESLAGVPAGTSFTWTPQTAEAGGEQGFTWGTYRLSGSNARGEPTLAYGKYLSTWKRELGGWKLQAMMLNQSPGPAG